MIENTTTPDQDLSVYFDEIDEYLKKPLKSREELKAEEEAKAVAQQARYETLQKEFDKTEIAMKLHEYRKGFGEEAFRRFMQGASSNSEEYQILLGMITDLMFAQDPRYQVLNQRYREHREKYIQSH